MTATTVDVNTLRARLALLASRVVDLASEVGMEAATGTHDRRAVLAAIASMAAAERAAQTALHALSWHAHTTAVSDTEPPAPNPATSGSRRQRG